MKPITEKSMIELPWPPSVNSYYPTIIVRGKVKRLVSKKGRTFRKAVKDEVLVQRTSYFGAKRLRVTMDAYPPDKRRHDLDNILKPTFDALEKAGVYDDDSQIDDLRIVRREVSKPGRVDIIIEVMK